MHLLKEIVMARKINAILVVGLFASHAMAGTFSMDPWIVYLEPAGQKTSTVLTLRYSGPAPGSAPLPGDAVSEPIPVEISVVRREIDVDGKAAYPPGDPLTDFVIYPSQIILYPGDVTKVQLQWTGEKIPDKELTFGLIADQVAVDSERKSPGKKAMAGVSILTRYEGIVVLRPAKFKPQVEVDTNYTRKDSTGNLLVVMLNNKGTGMQSLKKITLTVAPLDAAGKPDMNKRITFDPNLPAKVIGNSLFAGFKRRIETPWPAQLPVGPVKVWAVFRE